MPYVTQDRRLALHQGSNIEGPGELNYLITRLFHKYMQQHGLNYRVINDIVGAAEGAKAEFHRRVAAPYEDKKILQNGDVYVGKETNGGV